MTRRLFGMLGLTALVALLAFVASVATGQAQSGRSVSWVNYDVTIEVRDDGSFGVEERMEVAFSGSPPFTYGYADIPLARVEEIANVTVREVTATGSVPFRQVERTDPEREPATFKAYPTGGRLHVEYSFSPTTDQTRTFVLAYDAVGALRAYPDETPPNEQVYWNAIGEEVTEIAPVRTASVTIRLPRSVDPAEVVLGEDTPGPAAERTEDGQTWRWERAGLDRGDAFVARMQFPPITGAAPPAWQAADDRERAEEERAERRRTLLGVAILGLGGLGMTGGGLWLYRTWYQKGRDPHVGLVAEELTEPPDDLPAGLVGTLVDERAQTRELVATLLDLARRGFLSVEPTGDKSFQVRAGDVGSTDGLLPFERALLAALFPLVQSGALADLGSARARISKQASAIQGQMYDELARRGYVEESPKDVRRRWSLIGGGFLGVAFLFGSTLSGALGWPGLVLAIFLGIAGVAVLLAGNAMPRRTLKGAEAAARWRAFGRYLAGIERFGDLSPLARDPELFERYLPFATALGHDKHWVTVFSRAGAPAPRWYAPSSGSAWAGAGRRSAAGSGGASFDVPSMPGPQAMSDRAARSLSAVNDGIFAFLNTASAAFTPPSSKGGSGGFSGGGGRGGGGGGGGRGFG